MTETTHILQAKLQRAATDVWYAINGRCAVTLVAYYAQGSSGDGNAIISTLSLGDQSSTIESVLARWAESEVPARDPLVWVPDAFQLKQIAEQVRNAMPFAVRFAIFFGASHDSIYVSFAERAEMQRFLEEKMLPHLRARQAVAPQPGGDG
ncbi:MAG TPA: hypothetical protein VJN18_32550 [Polyangiaceae bacterium]|nr:hypothetical protein [Polyangiaceae bacterium]